MDRESFLETIKAQFSEEIREAYLECEGEQGVIDWVKLDGYIAKLGEHASVRGLSRADFDELVRTVIPPKTELRAA